MKKYKKKGVNILRAIFGVFLILGKTTNKKRKTAKKNKKATKLKKRTTEENEKLDKKE